MERLMVHSILLSLFLLTQRMDAFSIKVNFASRQSPGIGLLHVAMITNGDVDVDVDVDADVDVDVLSQDDVASPLDSSLNRQSPEVLLPLSNMPQKERIRTMAAFISAKFEQRTAGSAFMTPHVSTLESTAGEHRIVDDALPSLNETAAFLTRAILRMNMNDQHPLNTSSAAINDNLPTRELESFQLTNDVNETSHSEVLETHHPVVEQRRQAVEQRSDNSSSRTHSYATDGVASQDERNITIETSKLHAGAKDTIMADNNADPTEDCENIDATSRTISSISTKEVPDISVQETEDQSSILSTAIEDQRNLNIISGNRIMSAQNHAAAVTPDTILTSQDTDEQANKMLTESQKNQLLAPELSASISADIDSTIATNASEDAVALTASKLQKFAFEGVDQKQQATGHISIEPKSVKKFPTASTFGLNQVQSAISASCVPPISAGSARNMDDKLSNDPTLQALKRSKDTRDRSDVDANSVGDRSIAAKIAHSFPTQVFSPAWYAKNPHLQTLVGVFAREAAKYAPAEKSILPLLSCTFWDLYGSIRTFEWDERECVETPDDDRFYVDWKYNDATNKRLRNDDKPVVLICHGLQSSSESPLVKDMSISFNNVGMDVACINFKGCGGEMSRTRFGYHLGFTDDLMHMIMHISNQFPNKPIYLSGFSLGANVVVKLLGELGPKAKDEYNIKGAAVNAVPFDLTRIAPNLSDPGFTKTLYGDSLLKSLAGDATEFVDNGSDSPFAKEALEQVKTIREFDNLVVCAQFGFSDANDYYQQSSTRHALNQIDVPVLIVQALDDPFFANNFNPDNDDSNCVKIQYTEHGGHCGFVFHSAENDRPETSWMPTQLSRFMQHVHSFQGPANLEKVVPGLTLPSAKNQKEAAQGLENTFDRLELAKISHSFSSAQFEPAWWAKNSHVQTILGAVSRNLCGNMNEFVPKLFGVKDGPIKSFVWDEIEKVDTADQDFFQVNWKYADSEDLIGRPSTKNPLVIICHGLQSNAESPLVKDMTIAFNGIGADVACINFRGCGDEINRTTKAYHLSFTDDLKQFVEHIARTAPDREIYLSGFSLGANVVTKYLADTGKDAKTKFNIFGAAVNAVPFDPTKTHVNLNEDGISKSIYGARLLDSMIQRVEDSSYLIPYPFTKEQARSCQTIMDMEELIICPEFGFENAMDYYEKSSTHHLVDKIMVPQLIIQSLDDPFFQGNTNPPDDTSSPVKIQYTQHGGHCGYVFASDGCGSDGASWMPNQLAKFIQHVRKSRSQSEGSQ